MKRRLLLIPTTALVALIAAGLGFMVLFGTAYDAQSPYAGQQSRMVSALSSQTVEGLKAGAGLGYAKAELNGWPGPLHILELAEELSLSQEQSRQIEEIRQAMLERAKPLGVKLIEAEGALDSVFEQPSPAAIDIERATLEAAKIEAELRAVHLTAHLQSTPLLSPEQKAIYQRERGYHGHHGH
ncbi:MAG: Spy/CpxP family protein refolding chaperone [Ahrensia sp.]|nr:Spy/CpxP family protein refolding chaperone [Ahrensia sp.]